MSPPVRTVFSGKEEWFVQSEIKKTCSIQTSHLVNIYIIDLVYAYYVSIPKNKGNHSKNCSWKEVNTDLSVQNNENKR